ncbi:MAG: triose-phosphate isomerase [Desulfotomaculales bacterium]
MQDRKPIIAGNWKMHKTPAEALAFVRDFLPRLAGLAGVEVVLCPAFPALVTLAGALAGSGVALGAQDMYWEERGAFTGEVSPPMLVATGCRYVILGHSERRQHFGETDAGVNLKVKAALRHGLLPIICVGEKLEEREAGLTQNVIATQVRGALEGLTPDEGRHLVIAYEPVWAIGTGRNARPEDAQEVNAYIRALLHEQFGPGVATGTRIQYGGSVTPANARALLVQPDIDGALVGGASLDPESFAAIVRAAAT